MYDISVIPETKWKQDLIEFQHSVFCTPEWLNLVYDEDTEPIYIDFNDGSSKIAKIAGLIVNNKTIKGYELYFYSGPALRELNEDHYNKCLDSLYQFSLYNRFLKLNIGSYDNKHSLKYTRQELYRTERVEYIIPVKDADTIKYGSQFKRNVKKAFKQNTSIQTGNIANLFNQLDTLIKSTHDKRKSKFDKDYDHFYLRFFNNKTLKRMHNNDSTTIYGTSNEDKINCAELVFTCNNYAYMLLKGCNNFGYKYGMSSFLSEKLVSQFHENNIKTYNLGGRPPTKDGDGLAKFKISSGAKEIKCYGASSNYLSGPLMLINPLLILGRLLPKDNKLVNYLKSII